MHVCRPIVFTSGWLCVRTKCCNQRWDTWQPMQNHRWVGKGWWAHMKGVSGKQHLQSSARTCQALEVLFPRFSRPRSRRNYAAGWDEVTRCSTHLTPPGACSNERAQEFCCLR